MDANRTAATSSQPLRQFRRGVDRVVSSGRFRAEVEERGFETEARNRAGEIPASLDQQLQLFSRDHDPWYPAAVKSSGEESDGCHRAVGETRLPAAAPRAVDLLLLLVVSAGRVRPVRDGWDYNNSRPTTACPMTAEERTGLSLPSTGILRAVESRPIVSEFEHPDKNPAVVSEIKSPKEISKGCRRA